MRESCPESPFIFMSTNKVYGDAPNELPLNELATRWDYADAADCARHRRDLPHRRHPAQPVRRVEGRGRRDGAGVRPLLRHADGLLPRRLPHRTEPLRRRAARLPRLPGKVRPRGPPVPRLRLQGQAGARQHPRPRRVHARSWRSTRTRASPRSTTSAAAATTACRCSRRSRASRSCIGQEARLRVRRPEPRRRPHLLHQRPAPA